MCFCATRGVRMRSQVDEVLMLDPDGKNAFVLCTHPHTSEKAVVCVNKQPWNEVRCRIHTYAYDEG